MIIIWDCKSGRREFIEMTLKTYSFENYSCSSVSEQEIKLVRTLNPKLIITCPEFSCVIRESFLADGLQVWELGQEIGLPINHLKLADQLKCL